MRDAEERERRVQQELSAAGVNADPRKFAK